VTSLSSDADQLQHLDWSHQPSCQAVECVADRGPVTHLATPTMGCPCGPLLICQACADWSEAHADESYADPYCKQCGRVAPPGRLRDLYRVEPLA